MVHHFRKRFLSFLALSTTLVACAKEPSLDLANQQDLQLARKLTTRYRSSESSETTPSSTNESITYQGTLVRSEGRIQASYQYDEQKRLVYQEAVLDGPFGGIYKQRYEYTANKLVYTNLWVYPPQPQTYPLNPQGYVMFPNSSYDPDGYLIRRQEGSPATTTTQTVVAGNIVKKVVQDNLGRSTITYEYDLTKMGLPDPGNIWLGRSSRNLLVKTTEITESFTVVPNTIFPDHIVTTYTYEFDQQGLVKQQTAYSEGILTSDPNVVSRGLEISSFEFK